MIDEIEVKIEQQPVTGNRTGWEWMLVEIMGHRTHWGRSREEERFGAKMLRIDVPVKGDPIRARLDHALLWRRINLLVHAHGRGHRHEEKPAVGCARAADLSRA